MPKNNNVDINVGKNTLFAVVDFPPFVITLDEVEIAVFERVRHTGRLRSFDITFVYKDYTKPVQMLSNIEGKHLGAIKAYLSEVDIVVYESETNMTWNHILKTVNSDLNQFVADGCWEAYFAKDNEAGGVDGEDSDEEEESADDGDSEYVESGSSEEEEEDEDDSDDSEYVDEESSDEEEEPDSDEEEGLDWDEMDAKAAKEDKENASKRRAKGEDSDRDEPARKRRRR